MNNAHLASGRIDVLVPGRRFKMPEARDFLINNYKGIRYRDAMHVPLANGEIWFFDYGVLVCWNATEDEKHNLLSQMKGWIEEPLAKQDFEHYSFKTQTDFTLRISNDMLSLPNDNLLQRLAVSHAFAQSSKLGVFEMRAQKVISDNSYLANVLSKTGHIPLTRKALARLRGLLFQTRSDILLNFNLLDTPEFFWDYPELEADYASIAKYLDLVPRIQLMNHKLETIHELVDMLASEQNHKHSSFLEWIIIILIGVEIVLSFVH